MPKKKISIAQILHKAADEYLWDGELTNAPTRKSRAVWSCNAVYDCADDQGYDYEIILEGLDNMGLIHEPSESFKEFHSSPQRQAARYTWLKFAAMIAEEQGV